MQRTTTGMITMEVTAGVMRCSMSSPLSWLTNTAGMRGCGWLAGLAMMTRGPRTLSYTTAATAPAASAFLTCHRVRPITVTINRENQVAQQTG